jgi:hypothetical protein
MQPDYYQRLPDELGFRRAVQRLWRSCLPAVQPGERQWHAQSFDLLRDSLQLRSVLRSVLRDSLQRQTKHFAPLPSFERRPRQHYAFSVGARRLQL